MNEYKLPEGHVLCLRTNDTNNQSRDGFQWPESGECVAPDWSSSPICGYGLHGLLWGTGDSSLLNWSDDAKWLVVEVSADSVVDLSDKVKFPRCKVVYCGNRLGATGLMHRIAPNGSAVIGGTATTGYRGTATAGYRGTATTGDRGTATTGEYGTATAGEYGTATAGDRGTATAGEYGTAITGDYGTATAGEYGILQLTYWDIGSGRSRIVTKYVGEDGINPNTPYTIDKHGNVTEGD